MSSFNTGQQRHLRERTRPLVFLTAAVWLLATPPGVIAQESPGSSSSVARATGVVEVTFVDPFGISAASDLQISAPGPNPANAGATGDEGGTKVTFDEGPHVPASLTVTAAPRQPISIVVDDVVAGDGYSLTDFRCNYNAGSDTACDGAGYSETSVASGTLLVAATLTGNGTRAPGGADGSFAITISYQ